jgi:hypothetical protein
VLALAARVAEVVVVGRVADDREDELRHSRRTRHTSRGKSRGEGEGGHEGDAECCRPAEDHTHGFALRRPDPSRLGGGLPTRLG